MQLSEIDLFKFASLTPICLKNVDQIPKVMYKVWSGMTKFIRSAIQQQKAPICVEFGKFCPTSPVKFIPSVSFLANAKVLYRNSAETQDIGNFKEQPISYTAIAEACGIDRDTVMLCLKETLQQLSNSVTGGGTVVLHFRVGNLTVNKGWAEFNSLSLNNDKPKTSTYTSVDTPRTSRYTAFSHSSSVHPSNPNPIHQGVSKNQNNYYRGLKHKTDTSLLSPVILYTGEIHPTFNFRQNYTRKQAFEQPLSPEDLLRFHQEQIKQKKTFKDLEEIKEAQENTKTIQESKVETQIDKLNKSSLEAEKRKAYILANREQVQEKITRAQRELEVKKNEVYNYFPFTHGDIAEARSKNLNESMKEDMKKHFKSFEVSPISNKEPPVGIPRFMETYDYMNVRRTQKSHVEKAMKGALNSYYKDLRDKETDKIRLRKEKDEQQLQDEIYYKQLEIYRKKELENNLQVLNEQIEEKKRRRIEESEIKKDAYATSLDFPVESEESKMARKDKNIKNANFLIQQMENKEKILKEKVAKERDIDTKIIYSSDMNLTQEDNEAKIRDLYTKSLNKDIWLKQMEIKTLEKDVGKVL
ncbi:hypothetical protein SteCoe_12285 [Stentor coeruleus]|uniref:CCDC81 HU domain-containing protein n=1 Tax=Stentor coeruleus TaxID=5963 RepID=A0A1R2CB54_9CILI|nr:hypothetical protein SteCoe_12285 [Stentor coeruleus]